MITHNLTKNFLGWNEGTHTLEKFLDWNEGTHTLEILYRGTEEELLEKLNREIQEDLKNRGR